MPLAGAFTFVLHSHLPYCRQAGRWPHGEEWLHEAAAETYLPLLNALYDMAEEDENSQTNGTTHRAYYVAGSAQGVPDPPVAAIGRNHRTGMQVWSAEWGYPGDGDYREFHKKDHMSGMQDWRVTGAQTDLGSKDVYHPDWAAYKVRAHAEHFCSLVEDEARAYHDQKGQYALSAANYDTELFGPWWFKVDRFNDLADRIEAQDVGGAAALAETLWERDKVFPTLDYRWFAERQGRAEK